MAQEGPIASPTIVSTSVTFSATDRLLGRDTAAAGAAEEITVGAGLEFTGSGGIGIAAGGVTYARMQDVSATDRLLGRDTAGAGDPEELTVGGGVEFTGSGGIQRSALTGDVTAAAGNNATTIANDAVTYAKMQNVSAADRLLGRDTAGAGDLEELTLTSPLSFTGSGGIQWTDPWTYVVLGADFTTDQATAQDTGLKFTPAVSTTYEVEIHAGLRSGVAGIAPRPGVTWNTGNDDGWALLQFNDLGSVSFVQGNIAAAIAYDPTGPTDATNTYPCTVKAIIVAGAGAANAFIFTLKSETAANSVSVKKGSMLKYRAIA